MNLWIIALVIAGLLLIAGFAVVSALNNELPLKTSASAGCGNCNGKCTAENNCGLAKCGATNGGACTCGRG